VVNDVAAERLPDGAPSPRVLVLGATGRLGRFLGQIWTSDAFAGPVDPVWQTRRPARPRDGAGRHVTFDPLAEPAALARAIAGADAVLNLAGPTGADADHDVHAALARAILAARERSVPVFLMSSAAIYGRRQGPLDEAVPGAPETAYGRGKLAMEAVAEGAEGPVHVLRLGNVAGADALLGRAAPGSPVVLDRFTDGTTPRRAYIGPVGLAQILETLIGRAVAGEALPPILNLAAGYIEMASLLAAAGLDWTSRPAPIHAIRDVRLDTARLDGLVRLPPEARTAAGMVAEWRRMQPFAASARTGR
jgi:nucleoside-diphosphate-sugar epimerase